MKRALIISPYFPPSNAADMQRVRMSLPFFAQNNWEVEVVVVDSKYSDMVMDELLLQSVPSNIKVYKIQALNKKITSKFGIGSIALRSLWFYYKKVNAILRGSEFDLIYFSTTQFPICVLGACWKRRFNIPYIIDMQDPWHSDYYQDKPKHQRPPKHWFSYKLNKYMEPIAIKNVSGLISVSDKYINGLKSRYQEIKNIPSTTITFGAFSPDLKIAFDNQQNFRKLLNNDTFNVVYIGRGGNDMHMSIRPLFEAFKSGLNAGIDRFSQIKFYFIGTSYAPNGRGKKTIEPLALEYGIEKHVTEITDRISYYHSLLTLQQADALFIPGSEDPKYTASKIYPYLLIKRPLLAIFNKMSSAIGILQEYGVKNTYNYDDIQPNDITRFLKKLIDGTLIIEEYNSEAVNKHSAHEMAMQQCRFFDLITNGTN